MLIKEEYEPEFIFNIDTDLQLSWVNLSISEDWNINSDDFKLPHKAPQSVLNEVKQQINKSIINYVVPDLQKTVKIYDYHINSDNMGNLFSTGRTVKCEGEDRLSYACYFLIEPNKFDIVCSESIQSAISTFKIRLGNHISKQELYSLTDTNNIKVFMQNIDNLYAEKFIKCTENVLNSYTNFLNYLRNYDKKLEKFSDIPAKEVAKLKRIQKQGF